MRLLADAVRRAGSSQPAETRDALAATRRFAMVTGTTSDARGRRIPSKPVTIVRVNDGRPAFYRLVAPR